MSLGSPAKSDPPIMYSVSWPGFLASQQRQDDMDICTLYVNHMCCTKNKLVVYIMYKTGWICEQTNNTIKIPIRFSMDLINANVSLV